MVKIILVGPAPELHAHAELAVCHIVHVALGQRVHLERNLFHHDNHHLHKALPVTTDGIRGVEYEHDVHRAGILLAPVPGLALACSVSGMAAHLVHGDARVKPVSVVSDVGRWVTAELAKVGRVRCDRGCAACRRAIVVAHACGRDVVPACRVGYEEADSDSHGGEDDLVGAEGAAADSGTRSRHGAW